nr:hypothetical protein BaRGS_023776 [Batillaria attramentaria]
MSDPSRQDMAAQTVSIWFVSVIGKATKKSLRKLDANSVPAQASGGKLAIGGWGNTFCILKLSDLQDMNETVSFFLFGQVYKQLWKTDVGTVMGILNPDIMDPIEKNASEVSFTVKNPAQVMMLGQSKDLGWCIGKTKRGNKCSKFVNKKYGEYCEHHVQAAYKKTSSRRGELQGGCPGRKPKSVRDRFRGPQSSSNAYKHNGEYFQTGIKKSNDNKDKLTLAKLQQEQQLQPSRKVTTMSLHDLPPLAQDGIKEKLAKDNDKAFLDLVTTPTVGAMNLVKHIVKREGHETVAKDNKGSVTFQSIQASDLLKEHKKTLQERRQSREQLKSSVPMLGKGFQPGQQIDLFSENSPRASKLKVSKSDVAKLRAIQKIQAKGGLEKVDPNAVRKSSPDAERVKKRVLEQVESESNKCKMSGGASQGSSDDRERREAAPARKKSRLLGDVDLNSEEVQKLLKAKSSHKGALAEAEAEKEEKYFDNLEKREMMEEKMKTVTSLDATVFTCQQCKYTALSASDRCKQEGHTITRHKGKKRFFACKKCKHRITSLQKFPTEPCKNCGELCFERSTMHREKSGPKLESEILCIRGDEIKYLNSLQQKVYLNS